MTMPALRTVTRPQGNNRALLAGQVAPSTVSLEFVEVEPIIAAFRRMVRGLEFDVCEMALTTYLCAREHGTAFTALPVFLVRDFHHGAVLTRPELAGTDPKVLEGQRVGVNRGWTVTTGVWARAVLAEQYGVDLDSITWVLSGDEHVADYRPPANVDRVRDGGDLARMVADGELAAAIGVKGAAGLVPLVPDAEDAGLEALRRTGHYPINHLVVVRDDLLTERTDLAEDLFAAFAASKQRWVDELRRGIAQPTPADRTAQRVMAVTGTDPLPYGLDPNRDVLESLLDAATAQHILRERPRLDDLFAKGTTGLVG